MQRNPGDELEHNDVYHGQLSSVEAKKRLEGKPNGTFIIRYSTNHNSYFASIKHGRDTLEVQLNKQDINNLTNYIDDKKFIAGINHKYKGDLHGFTKREYENELTSQAARSFGIFQNNTKQESKRDQALESQDLYHGELSSKDAIDRLKDKPVGSFIIRYSTNHHAYFASIKNGNNTAEEVKLNGKDINNLINYVNDINKFNSDLIKRFTGTMTPYTKSEFENKPIRNRP